MKGNDMNTLLQDVTTIVLLVALTFAVLNVIRVCKTQPRRG
jgi:hypothetical protein